MDRRHFIRTTGTSLASLLFVHEFSFGRETGPSILSFPGRVTALANGTVVALTSPDQKTWTFQTLTVQLRPTGNGLAIDVKAPDITLSEVTLHWNHLQKTNARVLNDQWERTYGDASWHTAKTDERLPWYFMEFDGKATHGFGVKTGAKSFAYWQLSNKTLSLTLDTRSGGNGVRLSDRTLPAAEIIIRKGQPGERSFLALRSFCRLMCEKPRLSKEPVYGINDWYFSYGNNSEPLIIAHTNLLIDQADGLSNRPFSVIDAGWFETRPDSPNDCCWGDNMKNPNKKFGDMGGLAQKIRGIGMRPGIWTRPLCASVNDASSLLLPDIAGRVTAKNPVLDPTIPENLDRIKSYFKLYNQWSYELVKFDFTTYDLFGKWGFQMGNGMSAPNWTMNDNTKTNAEIILNLYQTIREAAGDTYIISCDTISHLSAGLFELNRIGDDTSGNEWARTRKMGVNTVAFRGAHQGTFYGADGDCVGITAKVPWAKNRQWMQLVAESGTPLFISAQAGATGSEQKAFIKKSFATASRSIPVGEPLDWKTNPFPEKWKLNGKTVTFNWA